MHFILDGEVLALLLFCFISATAVDLNYDELRDLGVSCPPLDSCRNRTDVYPGKFNVTCECDPSCAERGTCCIDSEFIDTVPSVKVSCIPVPRICQCCIYPTNVWIVKQCSSHWNGSSTVKNNCESDTWQDPNLPVLVPAHNPKSGYTYANYYCAMCNHDHQDAVLWPLEVKTSDSIDFMEPCHQEVQQDIEYNMNSGWGYWNHFAPGEAIFIPVTVKFLELTSYYNLEVCKKRVLWRCPYYWQDESVRQKCDAYAAFIEGPSGWPRWVYKNVHCAMCNGVTNFDGFICTSLSVDRRQFPRYGYGAAVHGGGENGTAGYGRGGNGTDGYGEVRYGGATGYGECEFNRSGYGGGYGGYGGGSGGSGGGYGGDGYGRGTIAHFLGLEMNTEACKELRAEVFGKTGKCRTTFCRKGPIC